jgi:hypothetical protein
MADTDDEDEPALAELRGLIARNAEAVERLRAMLEQLEFTMRALEGSEQIRPEETPGSQDHQESDGGRRREEGGSCVNGEAETR